MIKTVLAALALAAAASAAVAQNAQAQTAQAQTAQAQTAPAHGHAGHTAAPPTAPAAPAVAAKPTITSSIKDLLAHPATAAVLEKHLPGVSQHPALPQIEEMTLAEVAPLSGGLISQATIEAIDADIKAL